MERTKNTNKISQLKKEWQMKVLTYRDLESKEGILPLMDHAFSWPFNPRWFEDFVKIDPRSKDGPVGFCAVENGCVVGFVGMLDLATRTLDGTIENVGGIYGVATLPSHTRKGISTVLVNSAHQHFKEEGYRFSFLNTSHTIIVHAFYKKLGYTDAAEYPSAYKVIETQKAKPFRKDETAKLDFDKILKVHNEFSKDKTGFVIRDKAHLNMLKKAEGITDRQCIMSEKGYAIFKKDKRGIWIRELVALTTEEMERLISRIEEKAKDLVYDRTVLEATLLRVYKSRGYMIHKRSHIVLMVKPLSRISRFYVGLGGREAILQIRGLWLVLGLCPLIVW